MSKSNLAYSLDFGRRIRELDARLKAEKFSNLLADIARDVATKAANEVNLMMAAMMKAQRQ